MTQHEMITYLLNVPDKQRKLIRKAIRMMRSVGIDYPEELMIEQAMKRDYEIRQSRLTRVR